MQKYSFEEVILLQMYSNIGYYYSMVTFVNV